MSIAHPDLAAVWARSKGVEPINSIKQMILQDGDVPSVEVVREIDRRLKLCKNPEKIVGSKAYLAKKEKDEREASEKRAKKAEEVRKAMEDSDPFGNELDVETHSIAALDDDDDDDGDD